MESRYWTLHSDNGVGVCFCLGRVGWGLWNLTSWCKVSRKLWQWLCTKCHGLSGKLCFLSSNQYRFLSYLLVWFLMYLFWYVLFPAEHVLNLLHFLFCILFLTYFVSSTFSLLACIFSCMPRSDCGAVEPHIIFICLSHHELKLLKLPNMLHSWYFVQSCIIFGIDTQEEMENQTRIFCVKSVGFINQVCVPMHSFKSSP